MEQTIQDRQPGVTATGITGFLTLTKAGTTARTATFPDAAITVAGLENAQTFSALKTFSAGLTVSSGTTAVQAITCTTIAASSWGVFGTSARLASECVRAAGGTMGTPGATDVLLAAGKVYAGDTSATSIRSAGGVTCTTVTASGDNRGLTVAATGTWAATSTATSLALLEVNTTSLARMLLIASTAAADEKAWDIRNSSGTLSFRAAADSLGSSVAALTIARTGTAIGMATFAAGVTCTALTVGANQVVAARNTGWTAQTAGASKADLGAAPTVGQLASFCRSLYDALATHGLIGT